MVMMQNCGTGKARVNKVIFCSGVVGVTSVRFILVLRLKKIRLSCCNRGNLLKIVPQKK